MGLFGRKKPKGRELLVRPGYERMPKTEWTDDELDHYLATCSEQDYWAHWEAWSLDTFEHPTVSKLKRSVLDLARAAAASSFPQEFGAMLRLKGNTVVELVLLPTIQGDAHTILYTHTLPVDRSINGTLHSHPDPHPYPSDADFAFFESKGTIHLILAQPYGPEDWRAYDHTGVPVFLEVVD